MDEKKKRRVTVLVLVVIVIVVGIFYSYYQVTHKNEVNEGTLITISETGRLCQ